jgi:multidrug resistance efflux pump
MNLFEKIAKTKNNNETAIDVGIGTGIAGGLGTALHYNNKQNEVQQKLETAKINKAKVEDDLNKHKQALERFKGNKKNYIERQKQRISKKILNNVGKTTTLLSHPFKQVAKKELEKIDQQVGYSNSSQQKSINLKQQKTNKMQDMVNHINNTLTDTKGLYGKQIDNIANIKANSNYKAQRDALKNNINKHQEQVGQHQGQIEELGKNIKKFGRNSKLGLAAAGLGALGLGYNHSSN